MEKFTFRKEERLSKENDIQELFDKGSSFYLFPFKVFFMPADLPPGSDHQVLISVSKRNFKHAVDRNKIKRRMREAYRLQKNQVASPGSRRIAFIYSHKEILPNDEMNKRMVTVLARLSKMPYGNTQKH